VAAFFFSVNPSVALRFCGSRRLHQRQATVPANLVKSDRPLHAAADLAAKPLLAVDRAVDIATNRSNPNREKPISVSDGERPVV
jgi:hypothetical protein